MKQKIVLIMTLLATLFLTACQDKTEAKKEATESKTEQVAKPEEAPAEEMTKVYTYEHGQEVKQYGKETITYKGKDILKIEVELTQPFEEETKNQLAQQDLATVKPEVIEVLKEDKTLSQLLDKPGLTTTFDITDNYDLVLKMMIDMAKVDFESLKTIENFGYDFSALENTTAKRYMASLEVHGATELTP